MDETGKKKNEFSRQRCVDLTQKEEKRPSKELATKESSKTKKRGDTHNATVWFQSVPTFFAMTCFRPSKVALPLLAALLLLSATSWTQVCFCGRERKRERESLRCEGDIRASVAIAREVQP